MTAPCITMSPLLCISKWLAGMGFGCSLSGSFLPGPKPTGLYHFWGLLAPAWQMGNPGGSAKQSREWEILSV